MIQAESLKQTLSKLLLSSNKANVKSLSMLDNNENILSVTKLKQNLMGFSTVSNDLTGHSDWCSS